MTTPRPRRQPERKAPSRPRLVWGDRVRAERLALGERQADLAIRAGVSQSALSRVELGSRRVTQDVLGRIAAALDIPTVVLFPHDRDTTTRPLARAS